MSNKPIVISGGSKGLGKCFTEEALRKGHHVATFSRTSNQFILDMQEQFPEHFFWQAVDAKDNAALQTYIRNVINQFGDIYALINNAGIGTEGLLALTTADDIAECINLNLVSAILLTKLCCNSMLRLKGGRIINISSINGLQGSAGVSYYSAAKAGLDGFTRSLAKELGPQNITVNSIAPGYFESDMVKGLSEERKERIRKRTPLKRLATPIDIANGAFFFLSSEANFITGQTLVIDGGLIC